MLAVYSLYSCMECSPSLLNYFSPSITFSPFLLRAYKPEFNPGYFLSMAFILHTRLVQIMNYLVRLMVQ
jgi:hypothetical protein